MCLCTGKGSLPGTISENAEDCISHEKATYPCNQSILTLKVWIFIQKPGTSTLHIVLGTPEWVMEPAGVRTCPLNTNLKMCPGKAKKLSLWFSYHIEKSTACFLFLYHCAVSMITNLQGWLSHLTHWLWMPAFNYPVSLDLWSLEPDM